MTPTAMASGRSRLLYWMTKGICLMFSRFALRLWYRFDRESTLSCILASLESATNTTPSAPPSTTRRLASYCTWPGTV